VRVVETPAELAGLLTVDDVCAWFAVSKAWVYDEVEAGRLPYIRLGRKHLRFDRAQLEEYLQARGTLGRGAPAPGGPGSAADGGA
jgi:excisionase family DNA binding protein